MVTGRVALVTGAGHGIGAACARRLARAGASVIVNYFKSQEKAEKLVTEIQAGGFKALAIQADVTKREQVDSMVKMAEKEFGQVDILVNNAAHQFARKGFLETTWDEYQYQIDGSLKAVFNCCQAVLPGMIARRWGSIINVLTVQIWRPGLGFQPYAAGKGAVQALTRALSQEYAPFSIRVNSVSPSFTLSESRLSMPLEQREGMAASTPLGRNALPQDVAEAVLFLAGESADFITGANIPINGGQVLD